MNLFFWILVLFILFMVWLFTRRFFIKIGSKVDYIIEDTKKILKNGEDDVNE